MQLVRHLRTQLATLGVRGMIGLAIQNRSGRRLRAYDVCRPLLEGARALEIGGPSSLFARGGLLPLYPLLQRLDNCDFTEATIWHGEAAEGNAFHYDAERPAGTRFILDATSLHGLDDGSYDAVLSSHTLEHVANPLRALSEWQRVLRPDGHLVLVLPHLQNTFDHRRPVTTLGHLEGDYAAGVAEDDESHLEEFLALCDLDRVPERLSRAEFEQRTRAFAENRTLHHHVFDTELALRLLDRAGFALLHVETALPFHIVTVARRSEQPPDNGALLSGTAAWRRESVFRHDRRRQPEPASACA